MLKLECAAPKRSGAKAAMSPETGTRVSAGQAYRVCERQRQAHAAPSLHLSSSLRGSAQSRRSPGRHRQAFCCNRKGVKGRPPPADLRPRSVGFIYYLSLQSGDHDAATSGISVQGQRPRCPSALQPSGRRGRRPSTTISIAIPIPKHGGATASLPSYPARISPPGRRPSLVAGSKRPNQTCKISADLLYWSIVMAGA